MSKTLYSFDFDDTLCHTMLPEPGKSIWLEKIGTTWPHRGWWSKSETIDPEIFDTPKNDWVYDEYLNASKDTDSLRILATGRLQKVPIMRENIEKILNRHNLNWGGDTFDFKTTLFEKLINITNCEHFVMYDDREEHLVRFEEWALTQNCKVTIVDVVNKQKITIN